MIKSGLPRTLSETLEIAAQPGVTQALSCLYLTPGSERDMDRYERAEKLLGGKDRAIVENDPLLGQGRVTIERSESGIIKLQGPNNHRCDGYAPPPASQPMM